MSVLIDTDLGIVFLDLYTDKCPSTCYNFLKLCKIKYYHQCLIHTVKDFIAKTGDPTGTGTGGDSIYKLLGDDNARFFSDEIHAELKHSNTGTVAMASFGENLNASQFYITLCDDLDCLDGKYTVFGKITSGFETLTCIAKASVDAKNRPNKDIRIRHTYILTDPFDDPPQLAKMIPDASPKGKPKVEVTDDMQPREDWDIRDAEFDFLELNEAFAEMAANPVEVAINSMIIRDIMEDPENEGPHNMRSDFEPLLSVLRLRDYETGDIIEFDSTEASEEALSDITEFGSTEASEAHFEVNIEECKEINELAEKICNLGIKESDTGLAPPNQWDLVSDKQMMQEEQPLLVATCTQIISPNTEDAKYVVDIKKIGKYVVGLGDKASPTDIEAGMRVGVDQKKYQIQIPLPPKIDPSVTMMTVEEKPDATYSDIGGCKEQIEKIREVVELPMLHPEKFVRLGIDPPKGVLCYGPPGSGKTLVARAVANRTGACFIRVVGSELVQKYIGEGARMVRELFQMARSKKACILFFDEIDAIGGARFDDGVGSDNEVQRTMLEILYQLDGFDARGNIKVLMATNRPDILDPALLRPGRLDRKVEFCLPDLEGRTQIFKIHTRTMSCERDIRFELLAGLCPNSTGADIRSVCIEAGMYAIGARRKSVTEKDFLDAVNKVVKGYQKFSATPKYMAYYI
ncbi:Cyclophilin-type peptidyl-prolyl cis-trans isomerase domain [Arabidopsis suecica]|uniref:peptidylprolyl isomerase n=1 Tax=Arabidopsis suecica TaxID=45249 RepID=A0A8T2HFQ5_ARASU|nr:Cyclophilin-type peptidyl-prolyl cis-trans isomerase domain [Arabidopsis suecica]